MRTLLSMLLALIAFGLFTAAWHVRPTHENMAAFGVAAGVLVLLLRWEYCDKPSIIERVSFKVAEQNPGWRREESARHAERSTPPAPPSCQI